MVLYDIDDTIASCIFCACRMEENTMVGTVQKVSRFRRSSIMRAPLKLG